MLRSDYALLLQVCTLGGSRLSWRHGDEQAGVGAQPSRVLELPCDAAEEAAQLRERRRTHPLQITKQFSLRVSVSSGPGLMARTPPPGRKA